MAQKLLTNGMTRANFRQYINDNFTELYNNGGTAGKDGSKWYNGSGSPSSSIGVSGDYYINTDNSDVYYKTTSWSLLMNIKGLKGDTGAAGSKWYNGTDIPYGFGNWDDYYLQTTTGDVYQKQQASGSFVLVGNIRGPQGPACVS